MRLCIPVEQDQGLDSLVCGHFGSAPLFLVVDTESRATSALANNHHHAHGQCTPLSSIQGVALDGVVVGGIGRGALLKLNAAGLAVYRSGFPTVAETLDAFAAGLLAPVSAQDACANHGHGSGGAGNCGHGRYQHRHGRDR
jgi:predicted Fe-Mo cluster-binding NifX family protein